MEVERLVATLQEYYEATSNSQRLKFIEDLIDIFGTFLRKGDFDLVNSVNSENSKEVQLAREYSEFLLVKFNDFLEALFDNLVSSSVADTFFADKVTKSLLKLANCDESFHFSSHSSFATLSNFNEKERKLNFQIILYLTSYLLVSDCSKDSLLVTLVNNKLDLKFALFTALEALLKQKELKSQGVSADFPFYISKALNAPSFYSLFFKLLLKLELEQAVPEDMKENDNYLVPKASKLKAKDINSIVQLTLLSFSTSTSLEPSLKLTIIPFITKSVLPKVQYPLLFSDFYTNSFKTAITDSNIMIPVASLEGLFLLITKFNLDYPLFYNRLYELCRHTLNGADTQSQNLVDFFKLVDKCLTSEFLSGNLVASFTKMLARKCLVSSPNVIILSLAVIHNIIIRHQGCLVLLHRPSTDVLKSFSEDKAEQWKIRNIKAEEIRQRSVILARALNVVEKSSETNYEQKTSDLLTQSQSKTAVVDVFNEEEQDPLKTKAEESCLWELELLNIHFSASVRSLVKNLIFDEFSHSVKTRKLEPVVDFDQFQKMNFDALFLKEVSSKRKEREQSDQPKRNHSKFTVPMNLYTAATLEERLGLETSSALGF